MSVDVDVEEVVVVVKQETAAAVRDVKTNFPNLGCIRPFPDWPGGMTDAELKMRDKGS